MICHDAHGIAMALPWHYLGETWQYYDSSMKAHGRAMARHADGHDTP